MLEGIRVLDFGRFIAGPTCGAMLGDLGADVIRVEKVGGGEDRWVGPVGAGGEGAMFLQNNRNKRSLTLNAATNEGREILARLLPGVDVVIVNMPEGALESLGLDYERLRTIKPDLIYLAASAFGSTGPYRDRVGFDAIGQLISGAAARTGFPGQPVRTPVQYVDGGTALAGAIGVLAALLHRERTGEGQRVETSLLGTALHLTSALLVEQGVTQSNRAPSGNRGQMSAPNDIFAVSDGWILVQVVGQPLFRRWAALVGRPEWLDDPRFADDRERGRNWAAVNAAMDEWCLVRTRAEALAALDAARIPACPVNSLQDALDDPQVAALGLVSQVNYPGLPRPAPIVAPPFSFSSLPVLPPSRAPLLGEHTEAILREIDYSPQAIAALKARGVV